MKIKEISFCKSCLQIIKYYLTILNITKNLCMILVFFIKIIHMNFKNYKYIINYLT